MRCRAIAVAIVVAGSVGTATVARSAAADETLYADLFIDEISITRIAEAIQDPDPVPGEQSPVAAVLPLAVWTKLKGDAAGLKRLRGGHFLLYHMWSEVCPLTSSTSEEAPEGEKKVGVNGRKAWPLIADDLAPEVTARHWFDWRTVSKRLYVENCTYTVTVVDERGDRLPCRGRPDGCLLTFTARRPD